MSQEITNKTDAQDNDDSVVININVLVLGGLFWQWVGCTGAGCAVLVLGRLFPLLKSTRVVFLLPQNIEPLPPSDNSVDSFALLPLATTAEMNQNLFPNMN